MSDYITNSDEIGSIANAIRAKGGTSASLLYPDGFASAIGAILTLLPWLEKTVSPSTSALSVTHDEGKALSKVTVNAMPIGSVTTPATTINLSAPVVSFNANNATFTATQGNWSTSVTPTVSAGYVTSASSGAITVKGSSKTYTLATFDGTTINPSTSNQTVYTNGYFCRGNVTVNAIPQQRSAGTLATLTGIDSVGPFVYFPYGWWPYVNSYGCYTRLSRDLINNLCLYDISLTSNGTHSVAGYATASVNVKGNNFSITSATSGSGTKSMVTCWATGSFNYGTWTCPSGFRCLLLMFIGTNSRSHGYIDFQSDYILHEVDDQHGTWSGVVSCGWASSRDSGGYLAPGAVAYLPVNFSGGTFKIVCVGYNV